MSIPLKVLASTDTFSVLQALTNVVDGKTALFVRPNLEDEDSSEVDDRIALIVESSGSTGTPKRISISRDALLASARASIERIGAPGQWLLALPTHYIAGVQVLVRSILSDQQPVLMNPSVSFTAEGFIRSASLMQATHRYTSLVPAQLEVLAAAIESDSSVLTALRRFDRILVGGQAPNPVTFQRLLELGVNVTVTYGMTETCGGCVYDGVPLTGVEVDIDEAGQIHLAGPMLAEGVGSRFATADLGFFDEQGRLQIVGRNDRVINSGGVKLSLDRVEHWAQEQPGVTGAVAVPIVEPRFGETFACWFTSNEGTVINPDDAVAALGLAAKQATWRGVPSIPALPNGKPDLVAIAQAEREQAASSDN